MLTVALYFGKLLYFWLKFTVDDGGVEKPCMKSADLPKSPEFPTSYRYVDWEYFGMDNCLVVKSSHSVAVFNTPKEGEKLSSALTNIDRDSYDALKRQAERQWELESQVVSQSGLSLGVIQANTQVSDFTITCKDNASIQVHTAVLSSFWPFFANMMSNDCVEKADKTLHLDFPSAWVQSMVSFVYKQKLKMTFDVATGVLILSNMYLLPELGIEASKQIRGIVSEKTTLEDLFLGWERSREACNDEMKQFFTRNIAKRDRTEQEEMLKRLEEEKLIELHLDTVVLI